MTVVVITGILATIGFASVRGHVSAARGAEALNMVQSIRAAEEAWRSEHMMYLDVSTNNAWYPRDASAVSSRNSEHAFFYPPGDGTHADNDAWLALRPTVAGAVRFGYLVNAGTPGDVMTIPAAGPNVTWPTPAPDNWYVIQAQGDTDGDGVLSYYRASSFDGDVFAQNHGE
jgi:type II secretory pathway pseudopilin PulG